MKIKWKKTCKKEMLKCLNKFKLKKKRTQLFDESIIVLFPVEFEFLVEVSHFEILDSP